MTLVSHGRCWHCAYGDQSGVYWSREDRVERRRLVRELRETGMTMVEIGKRVGISYASVRRDLAHGEA